MSKTRQRVAGGRGPFCWWGARFSASPAAQSVSEDVDAYYRQMAYNYSEAEEKAKADVVTLENKPRPGR